MSTQSKLSITITIASCLLGGGLLLSTTQVIADGAGAFLGGMITSRVLTNMSDRTAAQQDMAYSQPQTVVVHDSAPSGSSGDSAESRIKQLDKLAAGGYITPAEYKQKKQAILDDM